MSLAQFLLLLYLLLGKHIEIARRSITVAVSFGLASALFVVVLGDASGYTATDNQKMKIAAIEAMWETEPPPASFTLFGLPNQAKQRTDYALRVPWVLGLITTHSFDETVPGIKELVQHGEDHIWSGMLAYSALGKLRADPNDAKARAELAQYGDDLGYALLLKRICPDIENATQADITKAAWGTVPRVALLFGHSALWSGVAFSLFFVRPRVLPRIDRTDSESALVALGAGVHPAAPLDRRRGGLGRRGSRPR